MVTATQNTHSSEKLMGVCHLNNGYFLCLK